MGQCTCKNYFGGGDLTIGLGGAGAYSELTAVIESYTKGLKTRLRDSMDQNSLGGTVTKTILEPGKDVALQDNPIYTEVIAIGKVADVATFRDLIDDIVEKSVTIDKKVKDIVQPEEKKVALIMPTSERLLTRRGSDAGDDPEERKGASAAKKAQAQAADKTRAMLSAMSNIPVLADYAGNLEEKWSIKVKEEPRELITATSLFHPFGVYSFPLYSDDGPGVLMSCLEWRLGIPYDALELFTMNGIPLNDVDTLQKEKQCIYVDNRITLNFFSSPQEKVLIKQIEAISSEPFILHKMALHKMTVASLKDTLLTMSEELAISVLKDDLNVSNIVAVRILGLIKSAH